MSSSESIGKFSLGDHVVYPLQGVGVINKVEKKTLRGNTSLYYEIFLEISDMTVMVPVDKTDELGIRGIVEPAEALAAINGISNKLEQVPVDWKARYQMNVDLLKQGTIASIAKVVQILYHRSKIKELPVQERKLYDNALRILIDESALSLGRSREEIEALVFGKLEKDPKEKES
ncbi:MAG: CarD family transcriptional regulator [Sphaerochaetaceae bacterium]|nr:CarD family transcriptional regulator [Sphaerochaetaceae bacterium]MDD3942776.1 CarD family transcriptional regulator [Sphaerochaetaceae bacterium]MDX9939094.1 CarD family transcriptional regulator [Sphaerochaetaceae bacterium]